MTLEQWRADFIGEAVKKNVLRFGEFTLKSGRSSPYFFNSGNFDTGASLSALSDAYARAIVDGLASGALPEFDLLFGPAYKGIPLVAAVAVTLATKFGRDYPYAFNRKEAKDHGEGGDMVGAVAMLKPGCRVLLVDDVITAGTAIGEATALLEHMGSTPVGVVIALDRQEVSGSTGEASRRTAVQQVESTLGLRVASVVTLDHLLAYVRQHGVGEASLAQRIEDYRAAYGMTDD